MNKFGKPMEEDFQTVCEVVEKMVRKAPGLVGDLLQCNTPLPALLPQRTTIKV